VSHNLRGPLASMVGLLNLAKGQDNEGDFVQLHEMMGSSLGKLEATLKEIVDYSRNVRGEVERNEIVWQTLLDKNLQKLDCLMKSEAIAKSIKIEGTAFYSDSARLEVVFHNILSNSILYRNDTKGLELSITISTTEKEAQIAIQDNGIGIKKEVLPLIFNMFYRGIETSQGAGLGLYGAKEAVTKLNGKIEVSSDGSNGTLVQIHLPNLV